MYKSVMTGDERQLFIFFCYFCVVLCGFESGWLHPREPHKLPQGQAEDLETLALERQQLSELLRECTELDVPSRNISAVITVHCKPVVL